MAVVLNVKKPRLDKDGNLQRTKIKGFLPISLGYGIYLGDSFDERSNNSKIYFLMLSADPNGNVSSPQHLMSSPSFSGVSLDELPFSKKFSTADNFVNTFHSGSDYWFAYTSEAVTSTIDGKAITYEALTLIAGDDTPGIHGLNGLLGFFKLAKPPQPNS